MQQEKIKFQLSYSGGTSRGHQLASFLERDGLLEAFFTPGFNFPFHKRPNNSLNHIRFNPLSAYFLRFLSYKNRFQKVKETKRYRFTNFLDRSVALQMNKKSDFFIAESQIGLYSIRKAKKLGMKTILDRTNSHILFQNEIVHNEYKKHGINIEYNSQRVTQKALKEYEESDFIFSLSQYVTKTFIDFGVSPQKMVTVPSGIEIDRFQPGKKSDDVFRIIYCGALCIKKGTHLLLKAFHELNLPSSELLLIGRVFDEMEVFLSKYSRNVRHIPYVINSNLNNYYSQGTVFVLPSLEEGLAKVTMESMACGLPVIASEHTGARDVITEGKDGFMIPVGDSEELKKAILRFYENPELKRQMSQHAINKIKDSFTLEKYYERWLSACMKIVSSHET
jgi:glycosyltransferase involved in cell wall biosynthesis